MTSSIQTLRDAVQQVALRLADAKLSFGHGTDNAHDEAAWLVLWATQRPLDTELDGPSGDAPLTPQEQAAIDALLQRRIHERKPLAYLTQQAWLQGVPFYIDERSIVPRSLIADPIADGSIDPWLNDRTLRVLDLCTGNGSLAILAALAWPDVQVDAADISTDALAVAAINVEQHGLQERIRLIQSDGLQGLGTPAQQYDLVLCNPPYVNRQSMAALPPEYRQEPALALDGGDDGMDFIAPILRALPAYMSEQAVLVLEIGHERAYFERAFPHLNPLWLETPAGDDQVLLLERTALSAGKTD